jgi:hypothetical protein
VRSPIVSIEPVDTSIDAFSHPLSFLFPSFWTESDPAPDLDLFCLAWLNQSSNWWECVANSSLSLIDQSKRSGSSPSTIRVSGAALTPGSYATPNLIAFFPVNPNPPPVYRSQQRHKHSKAGEIAGMN